MSNELPAATRHRRDMTEKLLKATLNPYTHMLKQLKNQMTRKRISRYCIYKFYRPDYGSSVWDPPGVVLQEELESVQKRAASFVTGNYN